MRKSFFVSIRHKKKQNKLRSDGSKSVYAKCPYNRYKFPALGKRKEYLFYAPVILKFVQRGDRFG